MWTLFKVNRWLNVNDSDPNLKDLKIETKYYDVFQYVNSQSENFIFSENYLEHPVLISYGKTFPCIQGMSYLHEYVDHSKEIIKIILSDPLTYVKGFKFLKRSADAHQKVLLSEDQQSFEINAAKSGLDTYVINNLRISWKNLRRQWLENCLVHKDEILYEPNWNHPICDVFTKFLMNTYRRGVDRFKAFICIGSSYIGKSVFFTKFIVPEKYFLYHSNNLEYSQMSAQPQKIFRILDDINWENVSVTEMKALLNRNVSSVDVKYGYEYIFPLIPIIVLNKEDYLSFQRHFSEIWQFIQMNSFVYPEQNDTTIVEEQEVLFTSTPVEERKWLFSNVYDVNNLTLCNEDNVNKYIKDDLMLRKGYLYDSRKYKQFPENGMNYIPNPETIKKKILEDYSDYVIRMKRIEMEKEDPIGSPILSSSKKTRRRNRSNSRKREFDDNDDDNSSFETRNLNNKFDINNSFEEDGIVDNDDDNDWNSEQGGLKPGDSFEV